MARPVNLVADAIRNVDRARQDQAHHARMVVIESCIVRGHDGIVFRHPFQLPRILYAARNHRIWIDRPALPRAQGLLLCFFLGFLLRQNKAGVGDIEGLPLF